MNKVYIVAAKRTAIGSFGGTLAGLSAAELGAAAISAAIKQAGVDAGYLDQVLVGNVLSAGQGMGPGRQAAIKAGVPVDVPAHTVNMICCSGMRTLMDGATLIKAGDADLVMTAGMESMSNTPFVMPGKTRFGNKMGDITLLDSMINDGLTDAFNEYHMGITAENVADKHKISREKQDGFAVASQQKALTAISNGRFNDEIAPLEIKQRKQNITFSQDEYPKPGASEDKLARLRPAFKKDGSVTAGNASGINDGAAAIILASADALVKYNLQPMAELVAYGVGGINPAYMGLGPVPAVAQALAKAGLELADIELLELNEAFAAQALGVVKELAKNHNESEQALLTRTNVNGGAIALGHPLGASGSRISVSLLYEMKKRGVQYGLASLCAGGGMGTAVIIKNIE